VGIEECITRFRGWWSVNAGKGVEATMEELRLLQTFATLAPRHRAFILMGALFTEALITGKELTTHTELLRALAAGPAGQRSLIAATEWLCAGKYPALAKLFPVALKQLFDLELVDEEIFTAWAEGLTRSEYSADSSMMSLEQLEELRTAAGPFIIWLQQAEEEEDDDDQGDNNDEEEEEG